MRLGDEENSLFELALLFCKLIINDRMKFVKRKRKKERSTYEKILFGHAKQKHGQNFIGDFRRFGVRLYHGGDDFV